MGSKQFQGEYIEYLQERNNELLSKLSLMKENYENKIFSKDLNKQCLMSMLEDVLNVCTTLPQEIDLIFDKMTAAMTILKNVLIKKSQMIQLADRISKSLNINHDSNNSKIVDIYSVLNESKSDPKSFKKGSTAKVSPMIDGHVLLTPRICLSRVNNLALKDDTQKLSPIVEASPETSSLNVSDLEKCTTRELRIPLERINYNKLPYKVLSEGSPKSRFRGPKTWKKSLSSKKGQIGGVKNASSLEEPQNLNDEYEKVANNETSRSSRPNSNSNNDEDPLEGPSWLYDDKLNPPGRKSARYLEFKRRKRRFASVFDKNESMERLSSGKKKNDKSFNESQNSESKNETNETNASENFIFESFSENKENDSTLKLTNSLTDRKCVEDSEDEHECDGSEGGSGTKMSICNSLNRSAAIRTSYFHLSDTDSSSDEEMFSKSSGQTPRSKSRQGNASTKKSTKCNDTSKSMDELDCSEQTPRLSNQKKGKNSKIKSKTSKKSETTENQKEDIVVQKESLTPENGIVSKEATVGRKKGSSVNGTKVEPCSPVNISQGRAKRKAAPANLTEPSLHRKLRRD